jgi:hypothetical protein
MKCGKTLYYTEMPAGRTAEKEGSRRGESGLN